MSRRAGWRIATGLLLTAPVVWAAIAHMRAEEAGRRLLEEVATAHQRTGYAGVAAERRATWDNRVEIEHDARTGRTSYRWGLRWRTVRPAPYARTPDPAAWCLDVEAALESYRAAEGERTRFLGRAARTIELTPCHAGRPRVTIVADAVTLLPLKVTTYAADGSLYRVKAFREVEIGPRDVGEDPPRVGADWQGAPVPVEGLAEAAGFPVLTPAYVPEGFRCLGARLAHRGPPVVYLVYSDGVSVFELRQTPVWTPAKTEAALVAQVGEQRAAWAMRWLRTARQRQIARQQGPNTVVRSREHNHVVYDLRLDDLEVQLSSRADIDQEESVRVLRSLRVG